MIVLGKQNARTNIAPPIPKTKLAWTNNWFRNNHSASMSVSWFSAVDHDAQIVDLYKFDGQFVPPSEIDEDPIIDVRYSYFLEDFFNSAVTLSAGVNNLLDYKPTILLPAAKSVANRQTDAGCQGCRRKSQGMWVPWLFLY